LTPALSIGNIVSLPFENNFDFGVGPEDALVYTLNLKPVYPLNLGKVNLINRFILPVIYQEERVEGEGSEFGLGDFTYQAFFSPAESKKLIWGVGPALVFPTNTDDRLGVDKWSAGPAVVVLAKPGPWLVGALVQNVWSYAGDSDRQDISNTFLQPFAAYTWPSAWTFSVQSESTYNWKTEKWSVPINAAVTKLVRWGRLPVSLQAGVGYWAESPETGPEGFRFRLQATFVLPKLF